MKKTIIAILVFFQIPAYSQKAYFIGNYEKARMNDRDTAIYIYLSFNSVKEIKSAKINKGKELWLQTKSGSWQIKGYNAADKTYDLTFRYNNGTVEDVSFSPVYHDAPPTNNSIQPDGYSLYIGDNGFSKINGQNSVMGRFKKKIKAQRSSNF
jgi:hypothetical protein